MRISKLLPLVGIALFFLILFNIDLPRISETLGGLRADYTIISLGLLVPVMLLRGEKWRMIIRSYGIEYGLLKATKAWVVGFFIGIVTPGRIGDLSRAYYLKRDKSVSTGKSLTTVVVGRLIDVGTLFFLAVIGLMMFASSYMAAGHMLIYVIGSSLAFVTAVALFLRKGLIRSILKPLSSRFMPGKYQGLISRIFHDFYTGIGQMSKWGMTGSFHLGIVTWSIMIYQYQLLAMALGLDLAYAFMFAVVPVLALLDALPISFSGIGTRDAALIFFFSIVSVSAETAVSLSLLIFFVNYVIAGLAGLLLWLRDPIRMGMHQIASNI
jgi:uncharacterized protein (TIRG00374 family)